MATVPVFKMLPSARTDRYFNRKIIKQHGLVHDGVSVAAMNRMRDTSPYLWEERLWPKDKMF